MDPLPDDLDDPRLLPACEVQNLQGCKVLEGRCQLDVNRKVVSVFPDSEAVHDLDAELFVTIAGDRLRLHGVAKTDDPGARLRYDGRIGDEPPAAV